MTTPGSATQRAQNSRSPRSSLAAAVAVLAVVCATTTAGSLTADKAGHAHRGTVQPGNPQNTTDVIVVRGADFPTSRTAQLTLLGCADLYQRTDEPLQPRIGRGPNPPPLGTRSVSYDLAGGNAIGPLYYLTSLPTTHTAGLSVHSETSSTGIAYAGYQDPTADPETLWIGRAELAATPQWQPINLADLIYTWTQVNAKTGTPTGTRAAPTDAAAFASHHGGDGAGFFTAGFGCNGNPFEMDAWYINNQTYDLEGLTTTLRNTTSDTTITAGQTLTLTANLTDNNGRPLPRATLILETRTPPDHTWTTVEVIPVQNTTATTTVTPSQDAIYRWRFADRPLAEASTSTETHIHVRTDDTTDDPPPNASPTKSPPDPNNVHPKTAHPDDPSRGPLKTSPPEEHGSDEPLQPGPTAPRTVIPEPPLPNRAGVTQQSPQ